MHFKSFLSKFPPPEFLDVSFSGLVFSDNKIKVLTLDKSNFHPVFSKEVDLEPGIIEEGLVKNEESLIKSLSSIRAMVKSPFVRVALPDQISYVFSAKVPVQPDKDARESVAFILEENVPLPLADISFDFIPLGLEEKEGTFSANVVVTAVSSAVESAYLKALEAAEFETLLCISESQSMARSVIPRMDRKSQENFALICVHNDSVGIYLTYKGVVKFSSILAISPEESESFASLVITEFKKISDYWKEGNLKCILCGRHEICKKVLKAFEMTGGFSVSLANVWVNAFSLQNYIPEISFEDSLHFAGAVGLFL